MLSNSTAAALLAIFCVGAAAGGAYMAAKPVGQSTLAASGGEAAAGEMPLPAVHVTEALVDPVERVETEAAAEPRPAPSPRAPRAAAAPRAASPAPRAASPAPRAVPEPTGPLGAEEALARRPSTAPAAAPPLADEPLTMPERELAVALPIEAPLPPLPPLRLFEDLTVPASSVVGLQIETAVSSERARLEDRVEARVLRDVSVDGRTAVPSGTRAIGVVTLVERGGKLKERARIGVRFHTLVLADGTQLPMRTDTIFREGDSPGSESARKIGGAAAGGAILGAIIGGKKGAIVGGATGAAGGTAVVAAGARNAATLPAGAVVTVRLAESLIVEVERR